MAVTDIILDGNLDMVVDPDANIVGPSDSQHNEAILMAAPGTIRWSPISGVGIMRYFKKRITLTEADRLKQTVTIQLQADGCKSPSVNLNSIIDLSIEGAR